MNMLLSNFLMLLNLSYFTKSFLKKTSVSRTTYIICFILSVILLSIINYPSFKLVGTAIMNIIYFLSIFHLFKGETYKKSLIFLLFVLTISFSELFITNLMHYLFYLTESNLNTSMYTLAILFSNLLTFIILSIFIRFIKIDLLSKYTKFMWFSLILPITTLLLLYNLSNYFDTFKDNITSLIVILGLIISNIISLFAISKDFERIELSNEIKNTKTKYEILNKQFNTNYYFLHDTIRELTKLSTLMDENNYLDFQKNVMLLNRNLSRSFNAINSNSTILNSLLNYSITDINKFNIDIKTVIEHSDFSFIKLEDQQLIFSKLLNIAISQCINSETIKPKIIFKTMKIKQQIIILISFTFNNSSVLDLSDICKYISRYNAHISEKSYINSANAYHDIMIIFFT